MARFGRRSMAGKWAKAVVFVCMAGTAVAAGSGDGDSGPLAAIEKKIEAGAYEEALVDLDVHIRRIRQVPQPSAGLLRKPQARPPRKGRKGLRARPATRSGSQERTRIYGRNPSDAA